MACLILLMFISLNLGLIFFVPFLTLWGALFCTLGSLGAVVVGFFFVKPWLEKRSGSTALLLDDCLLDKPVYSPFPSPKEFRRTAKI